jgi:hypothetical protein
MKRFMQLRAHHNNKRNKLLPLLLKIFQANSGGCSGELRRAEGKGDAFLKE